jgi:hypothetical protein
MTAIEMEVDAFLADAAESVNGKIYAIGIGWNTIFAQTFPATHPRIALGVTVHVPFTATNQQHRFSVHLEDGDGNHLLLGSAVLPDGTEQELRVLGTNFNVGRPPLLPAGTSRSSRSR